MGSIKLYDRHAWQTVLGQLLSTREGDANVSVVCLYPGHSGTVKES